MLDNIRSGFADGCIAQDLYLMGQIAAQRAHEAASGSRIGKKVTRIAPIRVTRDNVEDTKLWGNMFTSGQFSVAFSRLPTAATADQFSSASS